MAKSQLFLRPPWRPSLLWGGPSRWQEGGGSQPGCSAFSQHPDGVGCLPLVLPLWLQSVGFPCA